MGEKERGTDDGMVNNIWRLETYGDMVNNIWRLGLLVNQLKHHTYVVFREKGKRL